MQHYSIYTYFYAYFLFYAFVPPHLARVIHNALFIFLKRLRKR